ncbi:hypothetical protein Tco_0008721 [Tanacetum coccineum]
MYDSWGSHIRLFIKGKRHGRMMLDSIDNGPLVYPTVEENRQTRPMKYSELTEAQQLQDNYDVQATNIILYGLPPNNSAFQTEDLDAYDLDCDDLSSAKAVLMANLSSCDPDILSKVPYSDSYSNDMINQDVQEMQYSEQTHIDDFQDNEIHSDSNIILYSQYLQESQDAVIQDTNSSAPNDLWVLSLVEQMTDHVAHLDKENQTNKMLSGFNQHYDGSVIAKEHAVISVIDDEETLILEERVDQDAQ